MTKLQSRFRELRAASEVMEQSVVQGESSRDRLTDLKIAVEYR